MGTAARPAAFRAAGRFEFRMAVRSRALWVSVVPLLGLATLLMITSPATTGAQTPAARAATWAMLANLIVTPGVGTALADRFLRLRASGLGELLAATPSGLLGRMAGTLTGGLAASLAPALAVLLTFSLAGTFLDGAPLLPPLMVGAIVVVLLPGAVLLAAAAAALGLVLPLPLARVLVVLGWFWLTVFNTSIVPLPTATGTVLSPLGDYAGAAWFGADPLWAGDGPWAAISPAPTTAAALINLSVQLGLAAAFLLLARTALLRRH
jgi:ABC-2 type transport system permease protein